MNLIKYLLHRPTWQKLPPMPRQYSTEYPESSIDRDTALLMGLTHTRSPQYVQQLVKKHRVSNPHELIAVLPPRWRKRHLRARFMALIRRAYGVTAHDPMKAIARQHQRKGKRARW